MPEPTPLLDIRQVPEQLGFEPGVVPAQFGELLLQILPNESGDGGTDESPIRGADIFVIDVLRVEQAGIGCGPPGERRNVARGERRGSIPKTMAPLGSARDRSGGTGPTLGNFRRRQRTTGPLKAQIG